MDIIGLIDIRLMIREHVSHRVRAGRGSVADRDELVAREDLIPAVRRTAADDLLELLRHPALPERPAPERRRFAGGTDRARGVVARPPDRAVIAAGHVAIGIVAALSAAPRHRPDGRFG